MELRWAMDAEIIIKNCPSFYSLFYLYLCLQGSGIQADFCFFDTELELSVCQCPFTLIPNLSPGLCIIWVLRRCCVFAFVCLLFSKRSPKVPKQCTPHVSACVQRCTAGSGVSHCDHPLLVKRKEQRLVPASSSPASPHHTSKLQAVNHGEPMIQQKLRYT